VPAQTRGPDRVSVLASAQKRRRSQAEAATFLAASGQDSPRPRLVRTRKKTGTCISFAMVILVLVAGRPGVTVILICVFLPCVFLIRELVLSPDFMCTLDFLPLRVAGRGGKLLVSGSGARKGERFEERSHLTWAMGKQRKVSVILRGTPLETGFWAYSRLWPSQEFRPSIMSFLARCWGRAVPISHSTHVFLLSTRFISAHRQIRRSFHLLPWWSRE
jgi:hypothetical protein